MHRHTTLVLSSVVLLALLMLASPASVAHARHAKPMPSWFEIPNVAHRSEADAIRTLEALGLRCRSEQVASEHVGHVVSTVPAAGAWIDRGQEVVLRVGVPIRVQTIVPRIRRQHADEVIASLSDIYAIALNPVRGPARHEGRVVAQHPRAGAQLPFRGVLTLDVIDNRTTVPFVEGLSLRRALRRLERAGLQANIREVPSHDVRRATVLRQRVQAGRRVPFESEIRLRVAVPARYTRPEERPHRRHDPYAGRRPARIETVPSVIGMELEGAVQMLEARGYDVHVEGRGRFAAGTVRVQAPLPGAMVPRGTRVTLRTARAVIGRTRIGPR